MHKYQINQMIKIYCEETSNTKANILYHIIRIELFLFGVEFISEPFQSNEGQHFRSFRISIRSNEYANEKYDNLRKLYNLKNFPITPKIMHLADYIDIIASNGAQHILKNRFQ